MYREVVGEQVVLERDPQYKITYEDLLTYAEWLGMDIETEQHLLWIAQEGLLEEPPADWKPCKSPDGDIYYFNFKTGESMWDHPCDESFRELYREQKELSAIAAMQRLAWKQCCVQSSFGCSPSGTDGPKRKTGSAYKSHRTKKAGGRSNLGIGSPANRKKQVVLPLPNQRRSNHEGTLKKSRLRQGAKPLKSLAAPDPIAIALPRDPSQVAGPPGSGRPGTTSSAPVAHFRDDELTAVMKELGCAELTELLRAHGVECEDDASKEDLVEAAAALYFELQTQTAAHHQPLGRPPPPPPVHRVLGWASSSSGDEDLPEDGGGELCKGVGGGGGGQSAAVGKPTRPSGRQRFSGGGRGVVELDDDDDDDDDEDDDDDDDNFVSAASRRGADEDGWAREGSGGDTNPAEIVADVMAGIVAEVLSTSMASILHEVAAELLPRCVGADFEALVVQSDRENAEVSAVTRSGKPRDRCSSPVLSQPNSPLKPELLNPVRKKLLTAQGDDDDDQEHLTMGELLEAGVS